MAFSVSSGIPDPSPLPVGLSGGVGRAPLRSRCVSVGSIRSATSPELLSRPLPTASSLRLTSVIRFSRPMSVTSVCAMSRASNPVRRLTISSVPSEILRSAQVQALQLLPLLDCGHALVGNPLGVIQLQVSDLRAPVSDSASLHR